MLPFSVASSSSYIMCICLTTCPFFSFCFIVFWAAPVWDFCLCHFQICLPVQIYTWFGPLPRSTFPMPPAFEYIKYCITEPARLSHSSHDSNRDRNVILQRASHCATAAFPWIKDLSISGLLASEWKSLRKYLKPMEMLIYCCCWTPCWVFVRFATLFRSWMSEQEYTFILSVSGF